MSELWVDTFKNETGQGAPDFPKGLTVTGVITATSISQTLNGNLTVSGNLGVGGTLTYEDVTNIDSVGLITAKSGIKIGPSAGVAGTFFADGSYITAGIITANTYYGSGANLTGIDATQIQTGNTSVQTIDTGSDGHIKFNTEGTEKVRITTAGRMGIGEASPDSPIHIKASSGGAQVMMQRSDAASDGNDYGRIYWKSSTGVQVGQLSVARQSAENDGYLKYTATSGGSTAERFRISKDGAIGLSGANYGSSGQVLTSGGASAAPTWAAAGGGKLKGWAIGTSWYGTQAGSTSSNKIDLFSQAYTPTDANSNILIFVPIEIDARTASYADQIRIEGLRDGNAQHARWLVYGNVGNSSGSILSLLYVYKPTGWSAGSSSTFKVRLWSEGSSGSPSDQYNVRVHESSYYLLAEFGP
jgi:hypothetical protein